MLRGFVHLLQTFVDGRHSLEMAEDKKNKSYNIPQTKSFIKTPCNRHSEFFFLFLFCFNSGINCIIGNCESANVTASNRVIHNIYTLMKMTQMAAIFAECKVSIFSFRLVHRIYWRLDMPIGCGNFILNMYLKSRFVFDKHSIIIID